MGKLTNQLSTWRKDNVECKKGNVTTLWFKDTQPNIMFIQNDSDTDLFVSIDHMPTRNDYAFKVKAHNNRLVARPYKTAQLYILNDGGADVSCTVWSIFDTFRPEMLNDFSVDKIEIASATLEEMISELSYDGIIRGFASGVKVPDMTNIVNDLDRLISNRNIEGFTTLYNILKSLSTIAGKLQSIYDKQYHIEDIKPIDINTFSSSSTSTVIQIASVSANGNRFRIGKIYNDSETRNLEISIIKEGDNSSFILKPNETLTDVWIDKATAISLAFNDSQAISSDLRYWVEIYDL